MMRRLRPAPVLALIAVLALASACDDGLTRVDLTITGAPTTVADLELQFGSAAVTVQPATSLDIVVGDDMAGKANTVEVWAIVAGAQAASGTATVTPELHRTVYAAVDLTTGCTDACPSGEVACVGSGTETCTTGSDGCAAWSAVTACPTTAPACSNGACAATCTDDCTTGQTRCDGDSVETCGQFDADSCLDWSLPASCGSGGTCANGACVSDPCNNNGTCEPARGETVANCPGDCGGGSGSGTCGSNGTTCNDGDACTTDDRCEAGACHGTEIACTTPPAATCTTSTTRRTYASSGTCGNGECVYATTDTTCAAAPAHGTAMCSSGACGFTCATGYTQSGASCVATVPNLVFVSSASYTGNLGGLAGADAHCQTLANTAGLSGTFKAWLSTTATSAASRLTHSVFPYVLKNGTPVAGNWADLVSQSDNITETESGANVPDTVTVWTGTKSDGTSTGIDCTGWTVGVNTTYGAEGIPGLDFNGGWTWEGDLVCSTAMQIYCIQQSAM